MYEIETITTPGTKRTLVHWTFSTRSSSYYVIIFDFQANAASATTERAHGIDSGSYRAVESLLLFHKGTGRA